MTKNSLEAKNIKISHILKAIDDFMKKRTKPGFSSGFMTIEKEDDNFLNKESLVWHYYECAISN